MSLSKKNDVETHNNIHICIKIKHPFVTAVYSTCRLDVASLDQHYAQGLRGSVFETCKTTNEYENISVSVLHFVPYHIQKAKKAGPKRAPENILVDVYFEGKEHSISLNTLCNNSTLASKVDSNCKVYFYNQYVSEPHETTTYLQGKKKIPLKISARTKECIQSFKDDLTSIAAEITEINGELSAIQEVSVSKTGNNDEINDSQSDSESSFETSAIVKEHEENNQEQSCEHYIPSTLKIGEKLNPLYSRSTFYESKTTVATYKYDVSQLFSKYRDYQLSENYLSDLLKHLQNLQALTTNDKIMTIIGCIVSEYQMHKKSTMFTLSSQASYTLIDTLVKKEVSVEEKVEAVMHYMQEIETIAGKPKLFNAGKKLFNIIQAELKAQCSDIEEAPPSNKL